MTPDQLDDYPLARGWADIHAYRTHQGEALMWPDLRLSPTGRWLIQLRQELHTRRQKRHE